MDCDGDISDVDGYHHCDASLGIDDMDVEALLSYIDLHTGHLSDEDLEDISLDDIYSGRFEEKLAAKQLPIINPAYAGGRDAEALADIPPATEAEHVVSAKDTIWEEPKQAAPEALHPLDTFQLLPVIELLWRLLLPLGKSVVTLSFSTVAFAAQLVPGWTCGCYLSST